MELSTQGSLEACNAAPTWRIHQDILWEITNQDATSDTIVSLFQKFKMSGIDNILKKMSKNINKDLSDNQWFDQECKGLKSLLKWQTHTAEGQLPQTGQTLLGDMHETTSLVNKIYV